MQAVILLNTGPVCNLEGASLRICCKSHPCLAYISLHKVLVSPYSILVATRSLSVACCTLLQVTDLAASAERLHREHVVMIKSQMEVEEENIVNRLQRQI